MEPQHCQETQDVGAQHMDPSAEDSAEGEEGCADRHRDGRPGTGQPSVETAAAAAVTPFPSGEAVGVATFAPAASQPGGVGLEGGEEEDGLVVSVNGGERHRLQAKRAKGGEGSLRLVSRAKETPVSGTEVHSLQAEQTRTGEGGNEQKGLVGEGGPRMQNESAGAKQEGRLEEERDESKERLPAPDDSSLQVGSPKGPEGCQKQAERFEAGQHTAEEPGSPQRNRAELSEQNFEAEFSQETQGAVLASLPRASAGHGTPNATEISPPKGM